MFNMHCICSCLDVDKENTLVTSHVKREIKEKEINEIIRIMYIRDTFYKLFQVFLSICDENYKLNNEQDIETKAEIQIFLDQLGQNDKNDENDENEKITINENSYLDVLNTINAKKQKYSSSSNVRKAPIADLLKQIKINNKKIIKQNLQERAENLLKQFKKIYNKIYSNDFSSKNENFPEGEDYDFIFQTYPKYHLYFIKDTKSLASELKNFIWAYEGMERLQKICNNEQYGNDHKTDKIQENNENYYNNNNIHSRVMFNDEINETNSDKTIINVSNYSNNDILNMNDLNDKKEEQEKEKNQTFY